MLWIRVTYFCFTRRDFSKNSTFFVFFVKIFPFIRVKIERQYAKRRHNQWRVR